MLKIFKQIKTNHSNEEGFTLIELMIVVVIIGILAAIAIPIFANQQKSAADAALKSDIKTTANAMAQWLTTGNTLTTTPYVDSTFQYIIKYNNGSRSHWPSVPAGAEKQFFPGMTDFNISSGTRIGVKVSDPNVGFCVAGAVDGGNYDSTSASTNNDPNAMLFYDSATGKTTDRTELTLNGACEYFRVK